MSVTLELHTLILSLSLFLSLVVALVLYILLLLRAPDDARVRAAHAVPDGPDAQSSSIRPGSLARQRNLVSPHERPQSTIVSTKLSISSRRLQQEEAIDRRREGLVTGRPNQVSPSSSGSTVSAMVQPRTARSHSKQSPHNLSSRPSGSETDRLARNNANRSFSKTQSASRAQHLLEPSRAWSMAPSAQQRSLTSPSRSSPAPITPPSSFTSSSSTAVISPTSATTSSIVTTYGPDGPASRFGGSSKAGQLRSYAGAVFGASPFFHSEAAFLLTGLPDPSECRGLQLGDVFLHTATRFSPPKYQLWLWTTDGDGCAIWNPITVGHTRDDGKRLNFSPETKSLSWVTDKHFQQVLRLEQGMSSRATYSTITAGNDVEWA